MSKIHLTVPEGVSIDVNGGGKTLSLELIQPAKEQIILRTGLKGDKGLDAGIAYTHIQTTAASTWTINHNLGLKPAVQLLTVGGMEFDGEITHPNINQTIIYFSDAVAGIAQLRT